MTTPRPNPPRPNSNIVQLPFARSGAPARIGGERQRIEAAISGGDPACAAETLATARARGTIALRDDIDLTAALLPLLASEAVTAAGARQAAARLGWLDADGEPPAGGLFDRLRARLAAERWLDSVHADAARRDPFGSRTAAARRLIGRRPSLIRRLLRPRQALAVLLSELDPHREWVEDRLDPGGLDEARRAARPPD